MKNLFNNPWFVGALGLIAVAYLGFSIGGPLLKDDSVPTDLVGLEVPGLTEEHGLDTAITHVGSTLIKEDIGWLHNVDRDPFTGTLVDAQQESTGETGLPVVEALFIGAGVQAAVINKKLVRVGDIVDNYRVTDIADQHVQVTLAGRSFRLEPDV